MTKQEKIELLEKISESHAFTEFCKKKYSSAKRFGIDGCDAAIPGFDLGIDFAQKLGVKNVIVGMPHRGRLNTLACVFDKSYKQIFTEFADHGIETQKQYTNAKY